VPDFHSLLSDSCGKVLLYLFDSGLCALWYTECDEQRHSRHRWAVLYRISPYHTCAQWNIILPFIRLWYCV